eukprot:Gb_23363 [translate_table: standard]
MLGQLPCITFGKPWPSWHFAFLLQLPLNHRAVFEQYNGRSSRTRLLSCSAKNAIRNCSKLRVSFRLPSSSDGFAVRESNAQLNDGSERSSINSVFESEPTLETARETPKPTLRSSELELLGKPTAVVSNEVQEDLNHGDDETVAPYIEFFSSTPASEDDGLDEWEFSKEVGSNEQGVDVEFYDPQVGDLVVGVVVSGNANRIDVNIGSDLLATMLSKEVLPLYDAEMEQILCDVPREKNAEMKNSFATGKVGIVKEDEALSPGPGLGRPVVDAGTVLCAEVLGRTLSGKPLLSLRRVTRRIAWHRVRQIKELNEPIEVRIAEWNTGGLITRIEGLRAFLPKTELVNKPFDNFAALKVNLGRQIPVLIIRINEEDGELIVSEREAWDMKYLREGMLLEGTIRRIFSYGVQVRVDGTSISGLLHISNISRARVPSVKDLFSEGEKVKVMVVRSMFTNKISFSTAHLETEEGLILSNKERVFNEAEQTAAAYRQKLSSVLSIPRRESFPDDVDADGNVAECYANWSWLHFEPESIL